MYMCNSDINITKVSKEQKLLHTKKNTLLPLQSYYKLVLPVMG